MSNKLSKKTSKKSPTLKNISNYKLKLSQCMIVKNEEKNIKKALSWAKDIALEQIVVDTGSTDRTVEIAKEMGAKVYHFEWIDDFSAAKNYAIEQARGEWIAFLDADEYLDEKDALSLRTLISMIDNDKDTRSNKIDIIRTKLINIEQDGSVISTNLQDRIFKNKSYMKYYGKIHEQLKREDGHELFFLNATNISIIHTGYQKEIRASKGIRNVQLLEKAVSENPDDYDTISYLADSLNSKGEEIKAYSLYLQCVYNLEKMKDESRKYTSILSVTRLLAEQSHPFDENIFDIYDLFTKYYPNTPDADYFLGVYHYNSDKYKLSIEHMNKALENHTSFDGISNGITAYSKIDYIHRYLGYSYFQLKEYTSALSNLITYQKNNKSDNDSLMKILFMIHQEPISEMEKTSFSLKILSALYDLKQLKDVLICRKASKMLNMNELYNMLDKNLNEDDRIWLNS